MYSIKNRITTQVLLAILLGSALAITVLYPILSFNDNREFNESLHQKARTLITLTAQRNGEIELDFAGEFMPEYELEQSGEYFQLWLASKELIERSDSLEFQNNADLVFQPTELDNASFIDVVLPDGRQGRAVSIQFVPRLFEEGFDASSPREETFDAEIEDLENFDPISKKHISETQAVITVAKSTEELTRTINNELLVLLAQFSLLAVFSFFICKRVVERGLRPIQDICQAMYIIDPKNLAKTDEVATNSLELQPIAEQFNALVARINTELDNQKRFTGDVAHELRTPIAELKMLSEVATKWPEDIAANKEYFSDSIEIANNMERIVSDLLELVRADSGNFQIVQQEVDLGELVGSIVKRYEQQASSKNITIAISAKQPSSVVADRHKVSRVIDNLLSNAIEYGIAGSEVHVAIIETNDRYNLQVSNSVSNLDQNDVAIMFDRFWRKDKSRTGGTNSGLGLSIVKEICRQLGVTVRAELAANNRLSIALESFERSKG